MALLIDSYPKLTHEMLIKTGYTSSTYSFFYDNRGERFPLKSNPSDSSTSQNSVLILQDDRCVWHPGEHNLVIKNSSSMRMPFFLFGESGLAAKDGGIIGVAIIWMTPDSSVRGVERIGEINSDDKKTIKLEHSMIIPENILRGTLSLQTVLYLEQQGRPKGKEEYQASMTGAILGVLDVTRVIIEGNGSVFPIHEVSDPSEPLWYVRCDWTNPLEDSFAENFCICLNTANRAYSSLKVNEGIKNSPLLMEIIASSLEIMVQKTMDDEMWNQIKSGKDLVPGTVASMVHYIITTYDVQCDKSQPQNLALSLRKSIMNMM